MTRTLRNVVLALAIVTAGLGGCAFTGAIAGTASASGSGTPLPPGWELCILQGVGAPATEANIADLDEWQVAEGGSTNNTAAYNPFNTQRMTDASGAPLPGVVSANGFPAFANWLAGCAATVTTLFQPNMWSITSALRAGNVAPPGVFLAAVDQSAWCAPSADGIPCYEGQVLGAAGDLAAMLTNSPALSVFGNVRSDLRAYQQAIATVAGDQNLLVTRQEQLAAMQTQLSAARGTYDIASRALRRFAIDEYVSSGLYASTSVANLGGGVNPFGPKTAQGVIAQQYLSVAANDLLVRERSAAADVKAMLSRRDAAAKAVTPAALALAADTNTEHTSLTKMVADVATLQQAGACTTVAIALPASDAAPTAPADTTTTTTTTTTTAPVPTSTTTTTTTTVPAAAATTTTVPTAITVPTTVTTTTLPATTVQSTVPVTTTTTTTVPSAAVPATPPSAGAANAPVAGVTALQGCVAALAPPGTL